MFEGRFDALLGYAAELEGFSGYLDGEDIKAQQAVAANYTKELDQTVFHLLQETSGDEALDLVRSEMAALVEASPDWAGIVGNIEEDLVARLEAQSRRHPLIRSITHYALPGLLGIGLVVYFGLWFYNDLDVDQPIETRVGIEQRAAAFAKARNFDDWNSGGGRRRAVREILLKPFEPDEAEIVAAGEFVDLTFSGAAYLVDEEQICGVQNLLESFELDERHLTLTDRIAENVLLPETVWLDPPVDTVLNLLVSQYPCAAAAPVVEE